MNPASFSSPALRESRKLIAVISREDIKESRALFDPAFVLIVRGTIGGV